MLLFSFVFFAACTDVLQQATPPARLDLSLTGDLPGRIEDFELEIAAPDMPTMTQRLGPRGSGSVTLEVPAGRNRRFSIFSLNDDDEYDVYAGETVASVAPGREATVSVPVFPGPVIVDRGNNRVVQIRDMSGIAWRESTIVDDGFPFFSDAEFDADGRLWLAQQRESLPWSVAAFDTLKGEFPTPIESIEPIQPTDVEDVRALAVDNVGNQVFLSGLHSPDEETFRFGIWSSDLQGNLLQDPDEPLIEFNVPTFVYGLSIDSSDHLYAVTGQFDEMLETFDLRLVRYDAPMWRLEALHEIGTVTNAEEQWGDVIVRGERVYLADGFNGRIVELDLDLNELRVLGEPVVERGAEPDSLPEPEDGQFYGPRRFVATTPEKPGFIVIDDTDSSAFGTGSYANRLVSFADISGSNWQIYGSYGFAEDEFNFFDFC